MLERRSRGGFYQQRCGQLSRSGVFHQVGKLSGIYRMMTRFLASPMLLKPLNVKLSWYTLQNLKFLFLRLPCDSLYSPSGVLCNQIWALQAQPASRARGSGGADLKDRGKQIFSPHLFPGLTQKGCVIWGITPAVLPYSQRVKPQGSLGWFVCTCLGVCTIVTVTLSHGALVTVLWVTTV